MLYHRLAREPLTCRRNNLASNGKQKDETGGKQKHIKGSVKRAQETNYINILL